MKKRVSFDSKAERYRLAGLMANAVAAALREFQAGVMELPLSPDRIWRMVQPLDGAEQPQTPVGLQTSTGSDVLEKNPSK
jgi:hypothetical protein